MSLLPLYQAPGVCKVNSAYANLNQQEIVDGRVARGRYNDGDAIRFVAGFPEKIGGWVAITTSTVTGTPRGMLNWQDFAPAVRTAIGTNKKLFVWDGTNFNDATPWRSINTGALTNPFTTTISSAVVSVAHTAHGLSTADYVQLTGGATVGGLTIANTYFITKVDANNYTITASGAATSSVSGGGGTTSYTYYRITLGSNPLTTVSGSTAVTVAHTAHGALAGDYVTFSGASAFNNVTISGEYTIQTASTNSYTITAATTANASSAGGGTAVQAQYDISSGYADNQWTNGYGVGGYGTNGYGTTASTSFMSTQLRSWSFAPYGRQALANPWGGGIYVYDPSILSISRAYPLYGASTCLSFFVTPERFVFALGTAGNAKQVAWPDQNDYTNWTSTASNTANSGRPIQSGTTLVGGIPVRDGVSLFWTNLDCFTAIYTGDNFVYDTKLAGEKAGTVGPLAFTTLGSKAYWWGDKDFWMWDGIPTPLPSDDIRDYVFNNINTAQLQKCVACTVRAKKEVWFFYCSASSNEIDRYVIFHEDQQCFSIGGQLLRTCWQDSGLYQYPVACDSAGKFYNQEYGLDANGQALHAYITYAPLDAASGENQITVQGFWPDFERIVGNISLSVLTRQYPMNSDTVNGPFVIPSDGSVPRVDVGVTAHMVGFTIDSNVVAGDFRLGLNRAELQGAGARR